MRNKYVVWRIIGKSRTFWGIAGSAKEAQGMMENGMARCAAMGINAVWSWRLRTHA